MRREAVESSSLNSVGYEAESQLLKVEFHHGAVYRYFGVPPTVHEALMKAESKGTFLNREVRDVYPFERGCSLEPEDVGKEVLIPASQFSPGLDADAAVTEPNASLISGCRFSKCPVFQSGEFSISARRSPLAPLPNDVHAPAIAATSAMTTTNPTQRTTLQIRPRSVLFSSPPDCVMSSRNTRPQN